MGDCGISQSKSAYGSAGGVRIRPPNGSPAMAIETVYIVQAYVQGRGKGLKAE